MVVPSVFTKSIWFIYQMENVNCLHSTGNEHVVELLLQNQANVNAEDIDANTPLLYAIRSGKLSFFVLISHAHSMHNSLLLLLLLIDRA